MAIFGNNATGNGEFTAAAGRKVSSQFTLASAAVVTELHANVKSGTGNTFVIHVYADNGSGLPGARVGYTSGIVHAGSGSTIVDISQTGLSISLAAGTYWLGVTFTNAQGFVRSTLSAGALRAILSGAAISPPSDPWGTSDFNNADLLCVWAVTGPPASVPVANFTGTPLSGSRPLSVAFTDISTNTPTSWSWTFGDGGTSTSQNPTHSYTTAGTYTVALVATNSAGSDTETKTGYVTVGNPSGTMTKIKWGTGLVVTDEGGGVIRVDVV